MAGYNHFGDIASVLHEACVKVVKKTAFDLQAVAIVNAPVDTGFLRNSIYVKTSESSDYGSGDSTPPKGAALLPEVESPPNDTTAYVGVGASYGIYVEMGTRFARAQPYFLPAVFRVRDGFEAAVAAIRDKMAEAAR